jgi:hypothetical protein
MLTHKKKFEIYQFIFEKSHFLAKKVIQCSQMAVEVNDIFFNFLMLHDWLASQEGFSTIWQQVFRTYPNNNKTIFHNVAKLK